MGSSRGIPPPPGHSDIYSKSKSAKPSKIKISSRGIPPPPGCVDIWAQQQSQKRAHSKSHSQYRSYSNTSPQHNIHRPISPISPQSNNLNISPPHRSYSNASNQHRMPSPDINRTHNQPKQSFYSFHTQSQSVPTPHSLQQSASENTKDYEIDRMMK